MSAAPSYALWYHNNKACEEAILAGEPVEAALSTYGSNDAVLDFLVTSGLWSILISMHPDGLRKENGKPPRALNAVEVLRELARLRRIAHCGKILRDVPLMLIAGFNAEAVQRAQEQDKPVATEETLSNHLARISPASAMETFLEHVALMRRKRWIRGKTYAADAHEIIIPYGRQSERIGKVGEKYGYKLVILLNIAEGRERIVGFVLAPLHHGERTLLRLILRTLSERFGRVGDWMDTLILDRGYWGAAFLLGLRRRYGIDVVTRAQHDGLAIVGEMDRLVAIEPQRWQWFEEDHSRLGHLHTRCAGLEDLPACDESGKVVGYLNGVLAEEYAEDGKRVVGEDGEERPRFHYVTTFPTARNPYGTRRYYRMRWTIENQGFRELTQQWALDVLAGRRFNAINSRVAFALMLYNADRLMRMKEPELWERMRARSRERGSADLLAGPSIAVYTPGGHLGAFTPREYESVIARRERRLLLDTLRRALAAGESPERILERLQHFEGDAPDHP